MNPVACIVLPTYNEAENLKILLPEIFRQQERIPSHQLHVLVVDDNSPDGSARVVEEFRSRFPFLHIMHGAKRGLGDAYKRGISHAMAFLRPALIVNMDADLQHDAALLPDMIGACNQGYTLVIGSRYVRGGQASSLSSWRLLLSQTGNSLIRWAADLKVRDCTSSYRAIRSRFTASLRPRTPFYARLFVLVYISVPIGVERRKCPRNPDCIWQS